MFSDGPSVLGWSTCIVILRNTSYPLPAPVLGDQNRWEARYQLSCLDVDLESRIMIVMLAGGLAGRWGLYWRAGVLGRPRPQAVQAPVAHRPGQEVVRREPAGHRTPKLSNPDTPPQSGQGAWRNEGGAHGDADDGGGRLPAHHRSEGAVWGSSGEEEGRALTCRESGWADLLSPPCCSNLLS